MNPEEIGKEIFSLGGFSDSTRFMRSDEEMQQLQEQMAAQQPQDTSLQVAEIRANAQIQAAQISAGVTNNAAQLDFDAAIAKLEAETGIKLEDLYARIAIEREKIKKDRDITAAKEGSRHREMNLRRDTGAGI